MPMRYKKKKSKPGRPPSKLMSSGSPSSKRNKSKIKSGANPGKGKARK